MKYKEQIEGIVNYFKQQEKSPKDFKLGAEYEHIVVHDEDFRSVGYYEENGTKTIIEQFKNLGWTPEIDEDIIGAKNEEFVLTTEPGGQFEFSYGPKKTVMELETKYKEFMQILLPMLEKNNYSLLGIGYHPKTKISELKLLPKARYRAMYNHFSKTGTMGHNMMLGTAALQLSMDFSSEEDYIKKFRVTNALSNVLSSIFDNAYFFEGGISPIHNIRAKIWENTDGDRGGVIRQAFSDDFSYEKYAEYIVNESAMLEVKDGKYLPTDKKIGDLYIVGETSKDYLEYLLTLVFPDVRTKRFIEIRMADSIPYPYNMALFALYKGLFYDESNLNELFELTKYMTYEDAMREKHELYELGKDAKFLDTTMGEMAKTLVDMAYRALDKSEAKYLDVLKDLVYDNKNLYDLTKERYAQTNSVKEAASLSKIVL
ncbi:MAG: glutamate-cysteine ligase family protein [Tissierellia bacterium]|nr:glutamate-cysteine ligase family protein [Tissierellia bacterium]